MKDTFKISLGQAFAGAGGGDPTGELSPLLLSLGWRGRRLWWSYWGQDRDCTAEKTQVVQKGAGDLDQHAGNPPPGCALAGPGVSRVEFRLLCWRQQPKKAFSPCGLFISVFCLPSGFGIPRSK